MLVHDLDKLIDYWLKESDELRKLAIDNSCLYCEGMADTYEECVISLRRVVNLNLHNKSKEEGSNHGPFSDNGDRDVQPMNTTITEIEEEKIAT